MLSFTLLKAPISLIKREVVPNNWLRTLITGRPCLCEANEVESEEKITNKNAAKSLKKCSVSESIAYMESNAYNTTYKDKPVWHVYIRNFKGAIAPETRKSCLSVNEYSRSGSPCPICRDIYLLPHYLNVKLLKQFISPYGGDILETKVTGVCQKQQFKLKVAIKKAQNYGLMSFPIPHRHYDYDYYCKK